MKEFDPLVLLAVMHEMMGPILWILVAVAASGLAALVFVVSRDGCIVSRRLVRSEIVGVLGGFGALALMAHVTHSGFTDAGGPVDWLLIGLIWGGGLVGVTVLAYAVQGLLSGDPPKHG